MKRRIQGIYISILIISLAFLNVVLIHMLCKTNKEMQLQIESNLPSGDYLPNAKNPKIRVVLLRNGFSGVAHSNVELSAESGFVISYGDKTEEFKKIIFAPDDFRFQTGNIRIKLIKEKERITIHSLTRGYGIPSYRGELELFSTAEGIVIVNELPVEEYLKAVVPSEMPASYEIEALKCQAICARSYAYCQMNTFGYPEYSAHIDDSVMYQVYGNSLEQESTNYALNETKGEKLWHGKEVVKTYYYSTSSGHSTSIEAWGSLLTGNNRFLQGREISNENGEAYEKNLPWFQWKAVVPEKIMENLVELNSGNEIGTLQDIIVTKRGVGDVVLQLTIKGTEGQFVVQTENKIRKTLGGSGYEIEKQDGSIVKSTKLLPSAFFTIAKNGGNYIIKGGGYGHGIGMSQNGANEMAKAGKTYKEILQFFYPYTEVR